MAGRQPYAYSPASYGNQPQPFPSQAYQTNHVSNTRDIQQPPYAHPNISRSRSPDYQDPRVPRSPLPPASPRSPLTPASPLTPVSPSQPMLSPASARGNHYYNQPQYSHENTQNYYNPTTPTGQSPGYQPSSRAASPLTPTTPTRQSPGFQPSSRAASPLTPTTPTGRSPGFQPPSRAASPLTPTTPTGRSPGFQPSSQAASPLTPTTPTGRSQGFQPSSRAANPHMPPPVRQDSASSQQSFVGNAYHSTPVRQNSDSSFQATQHPDTKSPIPSNEIQTPNSSLTKQQPLTRSPMISNEKSADASGTTLQPPRNQPRISVAVSTLSERPSAIDKYNISPMSTQALWLNKRESDDDMHNPDTLNKGGCVWFSKRGCLNVGAFIGIIIIILGLFAAYPVYSAIRNGDFAVPVSTNDTLSNGTTDGNQTKNHLIARELAEFLKSDSPQVEPDGATYNLIFEEEFVETEVSVQTDKDST